MKVFEKASLAGTNGKTVKEVSLFYKNKGTKKYTYDCHHEFTDYKGKLSKFPAIEAVITLTHIKKLNLYGIHISGFSFIRNVEFEKEELLEKEEAAILLKRYNIEIK